MGVDLVTALVGVGALIVVVGLRSISRRHIEITLNDAIIAVMAAAVALLLSGRISKLVIGAEGVTVETTKQAILSASSQPIEHQVATFPVAPVEAALKGGVGEIPSLVHQQVQALDLLLGIGAYELHAMQQYLETLSKYPFFRFVVLLNQDMSVFGMIDAGKLVALLQDTTSGQTFDSFTTLLNRGSADDRVQLGKLPGFVPASAAVTIQSDKSEVLQKMEERGADWLPVLTADGKLVGIVDRSRLIASLILDVTKQLKSATGG